MRTTLEFDLGVNMGLVSRSSWSSGTTPSSPISILKSSMSDKIPPKRPGEERREASPDMSVATVEKEYSLPFGEVMRDLSKGK